MRPKVVIIAPLIVVKNQFWHCIWFNEGDSTCGAAWTELINVLLSSWLETKGCSLSLIIVDSRVLSSWNLSSSSEDDPDDEFEGRTIPFGLFFLMSSKSYTDNLFGDSMMLISSDSEDEATMVESLSCSHWHMNLEAGRMLDQLNQLVLESHVSSHTE